jgi:uncharacterized delta-60 repeat protein
VKGLRHRDRGQGRSPGPLVAIALAGLATLVAPAPAHANPGDLDHSFGGDGKVRTVFHQGHSYAYSVVIDSHERIVAAGSSSSGGVLARYRRNGRLDRSFGRGGAVTLASQAYSVAIDSHRRIVVAGSGSGGAVLARFKPSGRLDGSFGSGGVSTTDFGGGAMSIDSRDRIVMAGGDGGDFAVARYKPDGSPDASFGDDGRVATDFGGGAGESAISVAIDSKRRIVAAGASCDIDPVSQDPALCAFALARYRRHGILDSSFASGGKALTDFGGGYDFDGAYSVAIDSRDRVVAAGGSGDPGDPRRRFALARYRRNGDLDASFGVGGQVLTRFGNHDDEADSVAIDSRGRIVAAGSYGHFAVARYKPTGGLDRSFGARGKLTPAFRGYGGFSSVAIDSRDRVVAAGSGSGAFLVARFIGYRRQR